MSTNLKPKNRGKNTYDDWQANHITGRKHWGSLDYNGIEHKFNETQFYYKEVLSDLEKHDDIETVIELGCGNANPLSVIARKLSNIKFTGLDFTDSFLEYTRRFNDIKNLKFIKQDFLLKPLKKKYDAILMLETLEHVEEETNYKLVDHLLKKCKYLYISVPTSGLNREHISTYKLSSFDNYDTLIKKQIKHLFLFKLKGELRCR